jgi:hypothetical protein
VFSGLPRLQLGGAAHRSGLFQQLHPRLQHRRLAGAAHPVMDAAGFQRIRQARQGGGLARFGRLGHGEVDALGGGPFKQHGAIDAVGSRHAVGRQSPRLNPPVHRLFRYIQRFGGIFYGQLHGGALSGRMWKTVRQIWPECPEMSIRESFDPAVQVHLQ